MRFIELIDGIFNSNLAPRQKVLTGSAQEHQYPAFDGEDISLDKIATELSIEYVLPAGCRIDITLDYWNDLRDGLQSVTLSLDTAGSGRKTFSLPNNDRRVGIPFNRIRPRLQFYSDDADKTPIVSALEIAFRRKIEPRRAFQISVPLTKTANQPFSAEHIYNTLNKLYKSVSFVRLDVGEHSYYVNVIDFRASQTPDANGNQIAQIDITLQED